MLGAAVATTMVAENAGARACRDRKRKQQAGEQARQSAWMTPSPKK